MYIRNLITGTMTIGSGGSTPSGHSETRFTLQGGTVETHNITGTLDQQWMIDNGFFDYDTGTWLKPITEADIGNTVTNIGDLAFYECESLGSVTIPNTVISIGMAVFLRSGVSNIVLPPNVERIGDSAFFGCSNINSIVFQSKTLS